MHVQRHVVLFRDAVWDWIRMIVIRATETFVNAALWLRGLEL
jgi:hypothetical protein